MQSVLSHWHTVHWHTGHWHTGHWHTGHWHTGHWHTGRPVTTCVYGGGGQARTHCTNWFVYL
jgi:hypothetical protein